MIKASHKLIFAGKHVGTWWKMITLSPSKPVSPFGRDLKRTFAALQSLLRTKAINFTLRLATTPFRSRRNIILKKSVEPTANVQCTESTRLSWTFWTHRMGDTFSLKITNKVLYIQHLDRSRYDSTGLFRIIDLIRGILAPLRHPLFHNLKQTLHH